MKVYTGNDFDAQLYFIYILIIKTVVKYEKKITVGVTTCKSATQQT